MGTEGQWRLSSQSDARWQASGESVSFDGRNVPPEAKRAVDELKKRLQSAPPSDLACRFQPLHKSLPTPALHQLFEVHVLAAADKLESFAALFPEGEEGGPRFLPEQGELQFLDWEQKPTHHFKAQVLGVEYSEKANWRWAWHGDAFPTEITRVARRIHKFGQERQVPEFVNPGVPLGNQQDRPWFNGDYLALTALGLAGADAYYVLESNGRKTYLLLTVPSGLPAPESLPVRMGVILRRQFARWGEGFPAKGHRRAVRTYAHLNKCRLEETSETHFQLHTPAGELLHVHFEATGAFHTFECPTDGTVASEIESFDAGVLDESILNTKSVHDIVDTDDVKAIAAGAGWWKVISHSDIRWNCSGTTQSRDEFCSPPEADEAIEQLKSKLGSPPPLDIEIEFEPMRAAQSDEYLDLAPLDSRPSLGLRTLFAAHAARSHEKQLHLADYLAGEVPEWKLILEEGVLRLNLKERREKLDLEIQFLGLVSYRRETQWQWAWSDLEFDIPKELLKGVNKLRRLGTQNEIPELSEPHFPLGPDGEQPWFNGNYLALLASGLCGADFYYSIPWDDKVVLYLLVHNAQLFADTPTAAEMTRTLRDLVGHWGAALPLETHLQLVQAYTRQTGCTATVEQADKREYQTPAGETLRVFFERDGKIGSVESTSQQSRLPDRVPGKAAATAPTRPLETQTASGAAARGTGAMHLVKKLLGRGQPAAQDYIDRAATSLTAGDWESAHTDLCEAVRIEPNNPAAWRARGEAWLDYGENLDQALADLQEALMRGPPNAQTLAARGRAWLRKQNFEQAIVDCTEALRLDAEFAPAYLHRGEARAELGDHKEALEDFFEYATREPFDFQPFVLSARSHRALGDAAAATESESRAHDLGWSPK